MTDELTLDPVYLNTRRLALLLGDEEVASVIASVPRQWNWKINSHLELRTCADALTRWLLSRVPRVKTFELLDRATEMVPGRMFTVFHDFYCKGVAAAAFKCEREIAEGQPHLPSKTPPVMYAKYDDLPDGEPLRLDLRINSEFLVPGSPSLMLKGRKGDLFAVAMIDEVADGTVTAVPIFIGHQVTGIGTFDMWRSMMSLEVSPMMVENLARCESEPVPDPSELDILRSIPESRVKHAFAELFAETIIPKDWGGEQSDLFATRVRINGTYVTAAMVLKGPAQFREMTLAQLGKNGDQLIRLADDPADFLIVQHCHRVHKQVRRILRALCSQIDAPRRRFMIIDGFDTLRILRAYSKCGLTPSAVAA